MLFPLKLHEVCARIEFGSTNSLELKTRKVRFRVKRSDRITTTSVVFFIKTYELVKFIIYFFFRFFFHYSLRSPFNDNNLYYNRKFPSLRDRPGPTAGAIEFHVT